MLFRSTTSALARAVRIASSNDIGRGGNSSIDNTVGGGAVLGIGTCENSDGSRTRKVRSSGKIKGNNFCAFAGCTVLMMSTTDTIAHIDVRILQLPMIVTDRPVERFDSMQTAATIRIRMPADRHLLARCPVRYGATFQSGGHSPNVTLVTPHQSRKCLPRFLRHEELPSCERSGPRFGRG